MKQIYTKNIHGLSLIVYRDAVCMTVYEDSMYQIFHTENVNSVYDKVAEKVYDLTIDAWTKLVLKIEREIIYQ
jgi:hypothetical protein